MNIKRLLSFAIIAVSTFLSASAQEIGKYYSIVSDTMSIFPQNASPSEKRVVLWTDTKVAAQRWLVVDMGDGYIGFRNAYSGLYLAYMGNNRAGRPIYQMSLSDAGDGAKWFLQPIEGEEGAYKIFTEPTCTYCLAKNLTQGEGAMLTTMYESSAASSRTKFYLVEDPSSFPTSFNTVVRDSMMNGFLNQYYHKATNGHVLGKGGWWGDAEMFETILDAFETTGDVRYRTIFNELYNNFILRNGSDWSGNEYNDDITWMVLACVRAYKYFGVQDYLDKARDNYNRMYNRAHQRFGTLIWKQSQENKLGTNSCINCPATVAACYLAEATGDNTFYDKALSIYAGQRKLLFDASSGQVFDSRAWNSDGSGESNFNHWASTYNQGTMLGAAILLYEHTGNEQYLTDANRVHAYTIKNLCDEDSIIKVCQTISGDLCGFKGIYMRYARRYGQDLNHEDALRWMEKNAWRAYQNRNSKGVTWSAWLTKTNENLKRKEGNDDKDVNNDPFGASTAVSVAFNAHVNRTFNKDAFALNPVTSFDDIKFLQLDYDKDAGDTCTTSAMRNSYIGFQRVNFGEDGAQSLALRVNSNSSRTKWTVYADSIVDSRKIGDTGFITRGSWNDKSVTLTEKLTGTHTIYFVAVGLGARLESFRFFADATGITNITSDANAEYGIYDLNGRLVRNSNNTEGLPHGVYVINNGKKGRVILKK